MGLHNRIELRYSKPVGLLAQLVERLVYTENVGGSSPSRPTIFRTIALRPRIMTRGETCVIIVAMNGG